MSRLNDHARHDLNSIDWVLNLDEICPRKAFESKQDMYVKQCEIVDIENSIIKCSPYLSFVGLSAPVPRGRKGRKNREDKEVKEDPKSFSTEEAIAGCKVDPNVVLGDNGYKKHLHRHSNK